MCYILEIWLEFQIPIFTILFNCIALGATFDPIIHSPFSSGINEVTPNDRNGAEMAGFLLMGFSGSWKFQNAHASLFLLVDVAASTRSILIPILGVQLQTPMYFFLSNCFDGLNFCYLSVTVPKSLVNSFTLAVSISFLGCALQAFFFMSVASTETATLTMMSYDCYVVTYWPLYYEVIMNQSTCVGTMAVS